MRYLACIVTYALFALAQSVHAQSYPTKPTRLIIPFAPGGSADTITRPLSERLSEALGQPIVVENRAGGLTLIGGDFVAKSPPDGYTLYLMAGNHVLLPYLVQKVPFDPIADFTPISWLWSQGYVFVSHPSQPFKTLKDMVAYVKANPGKTSIGVSDLVTRIAAESFLTGTTTDMQVTPYKGGGPLTNDLLGGHISVGIASTLLMSHVKEGKLNALAVTVPTRLSFTPELPTVAEAAGIPGYDMQTWFILAGPAGMPAAVVDRLQREVGKALAHPEMRRRITDLGIEPANDPSQQKAAEIMRTYQAKMRTLIQAAGIKPE